MTTLLVVAKAPVPGLAKTRLSPPASPAEAAGIAAAGLLDTLHTVLATPGGVPVVAFTGDLRQAVRPDELGGVLRRTTVIPQRGTDFAARLAHAHADAGRCRPGRPTLQIGMDTPQVTAELLAESAIHLSTVDAVLGYARDGGWWALGLREPAHAAVLRQVPMSRDDTGDRTLEALRVAGLRVGLLPELSDVDTMADAREVAAGLPGSRFAVAVEAVTGTPAVTP